MNSRYQLPFPDAWSASARRAFVDFARALSVTRDSGDARLATMKAKALKLDEPSVSAAVQVLNDLANQGWVIHLDRRSVAVEAPLAESNPLAEKARVQHQELIKRDEQLASPSVRKFIADMERPRLFEGRFVSIFSLMRDGESLAESLKTLGERSDSTSAWRELIDPYVQVVHNGDRCSHTGLRLVDIWRYFRHTWTNQYTSTPGRSMLVLVRDRAAKFHSIVGIAALGSAIVQIRERDDWIGWQPNTFVSALTSAPTIRMARWIVARLEQGKGELYLDDLIRDDLYWPQLWEAPAIEAIDALLREADLRRRNHHRFVRRSEFKGSVAEDGWRARAESDLFRSRRCFALAELLRARLALMPFLYPTATVKGLRLALGDLPARKAIATVIRRAKAMSVGTEIADLTVCGAVAPYNSLLGGKLVSMLAVSPTVVHAYHERYQDHVSEIASSLAGRAIRRRSHLVFVGTTSLYGSGSSQYNRLRIPGQVLGSDADVTFNELGKSRSFGTSHLSDASLDALDRFVQQDRVGIRVNSIFGEGVSPKLRKVRDSLDLLGWPSNGLLQHRRPRIVYGVSLVENLLPYLLQIEEQPRYFFSRTIRNDVERITAWWYERWLSKRIRSEAVLNDVSANSIDRPVHHGARVVLPDATGENDDLFTAHSPIQIPLTLASS